MTVTQCSKDICEMFIKNKHYSRRPSIFWKGYCLSVNNNVEGVVVYGQPSPAIQRYAFKERNFKLYELSRLVVQTKQRNAASFLIAHSLSNLEKHCAVVSYADTEFSHCGIVYQATNWIYTGTTISHDHLYLIDGVRTHPMTLRDRGVTSPKQWAKENNIQTLKPLPKHRYFYLRGNKYQKRDMLSNLKYPTITQYPKVDQNRYDDGDRIEYRLDL